MIPARRSFGRFRLPLGRGLAVGVVAGLVAAPARAEPTQPGTLMNPLDESVSCQLCHTYENASGAGDQPRYAPYYGWQGSLMANAARDPVFWAGVALADQDHPGETVDCVRCHSPRAFLEGRGDATSIDDLLPTDLEGVGCETCHRMTGEGEVGNARYAIDDQLAADGLVPRRGPWVYEGDVGDPGNPPHSWVSEPFLGSSEACGTCHEVTTERPRLGDDGQPLGVMFNEQRTYSEWLGSAYAQPGDDFRSCQDCHMPAVEDVPGCNQFVDMYAHPTGGRRHDLVGANRFMVELLRAEYGSSRGNGEINDFFFNLTLERMDEFLATAATLEVEAPAEVHLGEGLEGLVATVTNESGHKLPTGYSEGRVMWLEVTASYADQLVWSSGLYAEGRGPQADPQLRTYQGVAEQLATGQQMHLLLNDHWVEDTRIPPRGLVPDIETDPVGPRYALLDDGTWPHYDTVTYAFEGQPALVDATPDDATDDVLDVRVRLLYLINTPDYVQLLADDNVTNDAGSEVAMLFDTMGGAPPLVLAEQSQQVPIVAFGEVPAGSTGPGSTGSLDSTGTPPPPDDGDLSTGGSTSSGSEGPAMSDDSGGCGCTSSEKPGPAAWWLGLVLMPWLRRRTMARTQAR